MQKIVINKCFGGFGLSDKALDLYRQYSGNKGSMYDINRDDPSLVRVVEELGKEAWSELSELKVVEIPDDVQWEIDGYDGVETIRESHQSWS